MKLCQISTVVLHMLLLGGAGAFTTSSSKVTGSTASSFTQSVTLNHSYRAPRVSVQLNMMFDQLTSALTSVAKDFGPKKRYVPMRKVGS